MTTGWPGDTYRVLFSAGESLGREHYEFDNVSDWTIRWSGDCTGTSYVCGADMATSTGDTSIRSTVSITHKATGETRTFTVTARFMTLEQIDMNEKGLFLHWLEIEKKTKTQKAAIEELNQLCGTKYTESWPSKMEGRGYTLERIPTEVRRYMMTIVLPDLLPGKSESEYKKLIIALT